MTSAWRIGKRPMLAIPAKAGIQSFPLEKPNYLAEDIDFPRPAVLFSLP